MNTPEKLSFPTMSMRLALVAYALLWALLLPLVLLYIFLRARKDSRYAKHLKERFGFYDTAAQNSVWVHAVSLGELRAAAPLIRALLDRGETVVITHFTPAGRGASASFFADEIKSGRVKPVYVPLEFDWVFKRFFKAFAPKYGLVMEIEIWPRMVASAHRRKVPLFMCNGHYPEKSFQRDKSKFGLRMQLMGGFAGMFIKSTADANRFKKAGAQNVVMTGELRFDHRPPERLTAPAYKLKPELGRRLVIAFASVVEGEDAGYIQAMKAVKARCTQSGLKPLFIYVPRAPERFDLTHNTLEQAGFTVARRSHIFEADLGLRAADTLDKSDILLGDSLGEMFFYQALADVVVVGGGFLPSGAHNIIEPLALEKPVLVGPNIWTIEFPALEAIKAGALVSVASIEALVEEIAQYKNPEIKDRKQKAGRVFYAAHTGAVVRTLAAIDKLTG